MKRGNKDCRGFRLQGWGGGFQGFKVEGVLQGLHRRHPKGIRGLHTCYKRGQREVALGLYPDSRNLSYVTKLKRTREMKRQLGLVYVLY